MTNEDGTARIPAPRANDFLAGQDAAERTLLEAYRSGRLPHAWLISGPSGVGKATLAFRFARFVLSGGASDTLAIDGTHPVARRIASGGHADLVTIERQFDEEKEKHRKDIAVADVRRIAPFLRLTPAEGGWRIVVVDGADGMNPSGQNAILKILEEPPPRSLLLLVTNRPSSMLPTIRSRCRMLQLSSLPDPLVVSLLARYRPDLPEDGLPALVRAAEGSIGRALDIVRHDGLSILQNFLTLAGQVPMDVAAAHALGDKLAPAAMDESFRSFAGLLVDWLARVAREAGRMASGPVIAPEIFRGERSVVDGLVRGGRLERIMEVWEKVGDLFSRSESANLDRRLTVISALETINAALR